MTWSRPKTTFADVGGMDHVKQQVNLKIIQPPRQPELYKAYGKKVGGGVLMYGPPGCGKTHLARATAGEVQVDFLGVGIHDVLSMWMGQEPSSSCTCAVAAAGASMRRACCSLMRSMAPGPREAI